MTDGAVMRLTVIGSSGSFPGPSSAASCYLVEVDDAERDRPWRVVLDLGNGALGPLQRFAGPGDLDAVLVSHLHPDHCMDLCGLYVALRYDPRVAAAAQRLPVHGPPGTLTRLVRAYGADDPADSPAGHDPVPAAMDAVYDVREWTDGVAVRIGPLTVIPRRVRHPVPTFGLRLEVAGRVLTYSADTDDCEALGELAEGADVFLCEASFVEGRDEVAGVHLTGRRAGAIAARAGVGQLVLTHIPPWTDPAVVVAEARQVWSGPLDLAVPGALFDV
ncbi:MAG: MBL fold metallo-hydrolase [Kineosporiaceae bacterium]